MFDREARASRLRFESFELDLESRELIGEKGSTRLPEQTFQLLEALLEKPGEVVSRDQLRRRLWGDDTFVDFDAAINTAVRKLREALGDSPNEPRYIETIVKRGYRFLPRLEHRSSTAGGESTHDSAFTFRFKLVWGDREHTLRPGENIVGRAPDATVSIDVHSVSRRHARVVIDGDQALLEDLESKNGTWVGDHRITERHRLNDGDTIRIGSVPVLFRRLDAGATTRTMRVP